MRIQGYIREAETNGALPGASVTLIQPGGETTGIGTIANDAGYFELNNAAAIAPNKILITHTGFNEVIIILTYQDESYAVGMTIDTTTLPGVVITSHTGGAWWLLALLPLAFIKNKSVNGIGKVQNYMPYIVAGAAGIAILKGFGLLNNLFSFLGFQKSEETTAVENEQSNPMSAFNPNYYKQGPGNTLILTMTGANNLINQLVNSFGYMDDDEQQAIGVFTQLKTKSQVSFLCDIFQQQGRGDMLQYLRGGTWPQDRLSDAEVNQIVNYVNNLPNYNL